MLVWSRKAAVQLGVIHNPLPSPAAVQVQTRTSAPGQTITTPSHNSDFGKHDSEPAKPININNDASNPQIKILIQGRGRIRTNWDSRRATFPVLGNIPTVVTLRHQSSIALPRRFLVIFPFSSAARPATCRVPRGPHNRVGTNQRGGETVYKSWDASRVIPHPPIPPLLLHPSLYIAARRSPSPPF